MANKHKFKLEAVLKLRKLKEDKCKAEIGRLQKRMKELEAYKAENNTGIDQAYTAQENALESGMSARELQFHPFFVSGKKANIKVIDGEMKMLNEQLIYRFKELSGYRGDVKVVEEMKEKDFQKYKKNKLKKDFEQIEEQVQNWCLSQNLGEV